MMMSNSQMFSMIEAIAASTKLDKHGGQKLAALNKMVEVELLDTLPETVLDPYRPCPTDWTAIQFAIFDNGEPPLTRKRQKIQRTKMRWGGNIKVWTRNEINFSVPAQVAWQANFHLWTAEDALQIVEDLFDEKYLDAASVEEIICHVDPSAEDLLYSVPLLKGPGNSGTRWMKGHVVAAPLIGGIPAHVALVFPSGGKVINKEQMSNVQANGKPFGGPVVAQARIARIEALSSWATEVQSR